MNDIIKIMRRFGCINWWIWAFSSCLSTLLLQLVIFSVVKGVSVRGVRRAGRTQDSESIMCGF